MEGQQAKQVQLLVNSLLNRRVKILEKICRKNLQIANLSERVQMLQQQNDDLYAFEKRLSEVTNEIRKQ